MMGVSELCAQSLSSIWLCDPMNCKPSGPSIHGILQEKTTGVASRFLLQSVSCVSCIGMQILYHRAAGKPLGVSKKP